MSDPPPSPLQEEITRLCQRLAEATAQLDALEREDEAEAELKNVIERAVYRSDDYLITDDEIVFDPFDCLVVAELP